MTMITNSSSVPLAIAAVGSQAELLAALAPDIAVGRASNERGAISVEPFEFDGQPLFVAVRGGDRSMHPLVTTLGAQGASRILHRSA
jgi:hypothetical protein